MKELSNISEDLAKQICQLMGKPFTSLSIKEETVIITMSESSPQDRTQVVFYLYIKPTGEINLFSSYTDTSMPDPDFATSNTLNSINTLPITDLLRKEGFEFKY